MGIIEAVVSGLLVIAISAACRWAYMNARSNRRVSRSAKARGRGGQLQDYTIEIYKELRTGSTFNIVSGHKDIISKVHHRTWTDQFENPYDAMDKAEEVIKKLDAQGKVDSWTINIT